MTIASGEQALAADLINGANMPSGFIGVWSGTIANIPSGWLICDGNNGTPNLLGRFVEGVATAATDPGTTGGATSKTTSGHSHNLNEAIETVNCVQSSGLVSNDIGYWSSSTSKSTNVLGHGFNYTSAYPYGSTLYKHFVKNLTDTDTDSISDIRPLYYDVAFIMKS